MIVLETDIPLAASSDTENLTLSPAIAVPEIVTAKPSLILKVLPVVKVNAPKIAFTGTPLIKTEQTSNEFGTCIDTYTIEQAVEDGSTVQIIYEGREAKTKVTGDSLDKLFDEYFGDKTEEEQSAIKKKYGTENAVLEAPQQIRWVCIDILKHYREHIQPNGFKAMIVTSSRHAATVYKKNVR